MTPRILLPIEPFTYDNIVELVKAKQIDTTDNFILEKGEIYLSKEIIDGNVLCESGDTARAEMLTTVSLVVDAGITYVVLTYLRTSKIVILYKDIEYVGSYYGVASKWMRKSIAFINDYFKNIIDMKMEESIENINIDSDDILAIVNKYDLPNSRDLMLVHAIDKYSTEMTKLLGAIEDTCTRDTFSGAIKAMKEFITPKEKETKKPARIKSVTKVTKLKTVEG